VKSRVAEEASDGAASSATITAHESKNEFMKRNLLAIERAGDYPLVDKVLLLKEEKQRWCVARWACRSALG